MKPLMIAALAVALAGPVLVPAPAQAKAIQSACLSSDRAQGNRQLCRCIQSAADQTLTQRDQRTGAKFFTDPDAAQDVRQSDRRVDEAFWERWRNFGDTATALCS